MPGGLLSLVCYGNENVIVNGNPQTTHFHSAFIQYTHFSQEPYTIPVEGPTQLQMDAPILVKAKIPRNGDLLSDLVLRFTLPDIFSKAYVRENLLPPTPQFPFVNKFWYDTLDLSGVSIQTNRISPTPTLTCVAPFGHAYSKKGFTANCYVSFTLPSLILPNTNLSIGLSTSPLASPQNFTFRFGGPGTQTPTQGAPGIFNYTDLSGTYSIGDMFSVYYRGFLMYFYQNNRLLGGEPIQVPQPFQTYYFDTLFGPTNDSVTNVYFGQLVLQSVVPFANNLTAINATGDWSAQAYSEIGYNKNITCCATPSFSIQKAMFGLSQNPVNDENLTYGFEGINYGFFITNGVAQIQEITVVKKSVIFSPGDVFCVYYDGIQISYYQNDILLLQTKVPNQFKTYYFDCWFTKQGDSFTDIIYEQRTRVPKGLTNVAVFDRTYLKTEPGKDGAWDSQAYSVTGYATNFRCFATPTSVKNSLFGIATSPSTDSSLNGINYGFYFQPTGLVYIYESGNNITPTGLPYSTKDVFNITCDGAYITYYQNNYQLRQVLVPLPNTLYYFDACFNALNDTFTNVTFGPKEFTLDRKYEFEWVRQIGARLIDTVTFTVGGSKIQEFTSDWISAKASLDYDTTLFQKWRSLIGDVSECFDPANGGLYPNVVAWRGSPLVPNPVQTNKPSIPGRTIRVPLGLWFSDFISNSLPLVALQYHDCEIQIKLRPIRDLYTVLDTEGIRLRSNIQSIPYSNKYYEITFPYIGWDLSTWVCPPNVFSVMVTLKGAQGSSGNFASGGLGGTVRGILPVKPGTTYYILSGQEGPKRSDDTSPGAFVYGGGSAGLASFGGGRTAIQYPSGVDIVTAGGGGGGGNQSLFVGGAGGGYVGGSGVGAGTDRSTGGGQSAGARTYKYQGQFSFTGGGGGGGWYGGGSGDGDGGDGGPAIKAIVKDPNCVAVAANGDVYISEPQSNIIRIVNSLTGIITTFAGVFKPSLTPFPPQSGDGGQATLATLNYPSSLAVGPNGDVYIADSGNNTVRVVNASTGIITTFAGTPGQAGSSGDGGLAVNATLAYPWALAVSTNGDVYISEPFNGKVRVVRASTGIITTFLGNETLEFPKGIAVALNGDVYIADISRVFLVSASTGTTTIFADNLKGASTLAVGTNGDVYIADSNDQTISVVSASTGILTTFAGTPGQAGSSGDGGLAVNATLFNPGAVALSANGDVYIADTSNNVIRVVHDGIITSYAGRIGQIGIAAGGGGGSSYVNNLTTLLENSQGTNAGAGSVTISYYEVSGTIAPTEAMALGGGVWDPSLYGPIPPTLNNLYKTTTDISGSMKYFLTDISTQPPQSDGWPLNMSLEALYTFVTPPEQRVFTSNMLRYTVRQAQNFIYNGVTARQVYQLDVHNLVTRIVFFARRSDAIPFRNQATNLTNWINTQGQKRPLALPNGQKTTDAVIIGQPDAYPNKTGNSGLNMMGLQRRILKDTVVSANGQTLFDSLDADYFTTYVPFHNMTGGGMPFGDYGLATQSEMWPIHVYSFALDGSSVEQPTGTLNASRINRFEMDIDVEPIPFYGKFTSNYTYEIQIFVETLNFLEISNGLGGLKFAK